MNIAVIFGGKSCEHNVSIITGQQAIGAIKNHYTVIPVYIDNDGVFWYSKKFDNIGAFRSKGGNLPPAKKTAVCFMSSSNYLHTTKGKKICKIDAAVLCTHGHGGEDGSLQGLLNISGIPFTGSGVLASSVGLNKSIMKKLFERDFLPVLPYISFNKIEYAKNTYNIVGDIKDKLSFPLIIKPANLGSSIGISVAHDFPALFEGIKTALIWDNDVVIENALTDFKEYNCAVLDMGNNELLTSEIEQPLSAKEFLSFDEKYINKNKNRKKDFPAQISQELKDKLKRYAKRAFKAISASGVARIDFLVKDNQVFINEINTIPGALSNYLFTKGDTVLTFKELIDKMITVAINNKKQHDSLNYVYKSTYTLNSEK